MSQWSYAFGETKKQTIQERTAKLILYPKMPHSLTLSVLSKTSDQSLAQYSQSWPQFPHRQGLHPPCGGLCHRLSPGANHYLIFFGGWWPLICHVCNRSNIPQSLTLEAVTNFIPFLPFHSYLFLQYLLPTTARWFYFYLETSVSLFLGFFLTIFSWTIMGDPKS